MTPSKGSWYAIQDREGETKAQRKSRMLDLFRASQNRTLAELRDILLPIDKELAAYVESIN